MRVLHMLHSLDADVGAAASTVRKGGKWADLSHKEHFKLCVCSDRCQRPDECGTVGESCANCSIEGEGETIMLWFGRFNDIPARYLSLEHEVRSREFNGLFDSMRKAYGETFYLDSPVTVVVYQRVA